MHYTILFLLFMGSHMIFLNNETKLTDQEPLFTKEQLDKADQVIKKSKAKKVKKVDAPLLFKQSCASCHGRKGGLGLAGAADLTASKMPLRKQVAIIYFGKNTMQAYGDHFSTDEIVAIAKYISTLRKS